MSQSGQEHHLNAWPYLSGLANFGHPSLKGKAGLSIAKNQTRDLDGSMLRRGGQIHLHRNPIMEGQAIEDHFLNDELRSAWTLTEDGPVTDLATPSYLHVLGDSFGASVTKVEQSLVDDVGDPKITALEDGETFTFVVRHRIVTLAPTIGTAGYIHYYIDSGTASTWLLHISFVGDGVYVDTGAGFEEIISASATNPLSLSDSSELLQSTAGVQHNRALTWRFVVTRDDTDYTLSVYVENILVATGIALSDSSTDTGEFYMAFQDGLSIDTEVYIDHVEVDAEAQAVRGLGAFKDPSESPVSVRKVLVYAGSRVYLFGSDFFNMQCIDDGLVKGKQCDFKIFNGHAVYALSSGTKIRRYRDGDRRATELEESPQSKFLQVHTNRLFSAGDPGNESRVYWCGLLDETDWNTDADPDTVFDNAGYLDCEPDDGQAVTALGPTFRSIMPIYKEYSLHRLDGVGPANYSRTQISGTIGATSHFAVVNTENEQYFVSQFGVRGFLTTDQYGDLEAAMLSSELGKLWRQDVNLDALHLAYAVNNEEFDRLEVLVPTYISGADGRTPNRIYCYQYGIERPAWTDKRISGFCMAAMRLIGIDRRSVIVGSTDGWLNLQDRPQRFDFPEFAA